MSPSHPAGQFGKLSDDELVEMAGRSGLSPEMAAALALEQEMRRISPAELATYRAQATREYAGLRATRRERTPQAARRRLWQARCIATTGLASVVFGACVLLAGTTAGRADGAVVTIFGLGMTLAGLILSSSAKTELERFGGRR